MKTEETKSDAGQEQKWTPEFLSRLFDSECDDKEAIERICALHTASISKVREELGQQALLQAIQTDTFIDKLKSQLATKRAAREKAERELGTVLDVRDQLAAAQAAIAKHNNGLRFANKKAYYIKPTDTAALDAYVREAVQPYVDALKILLERNQCPVRH